MAKAKVFTAFLLTGMLWPGLSTQAQTIVSETGRLVFFNSLDSAQGAALTRLASLVTCWLAVYDPRDSFPVLLDLRPGPDSSFSELGYDNLFGNSLVYPDSATIPSDPGQQHYYRRLGLRIRNNGPFPDEKNLLQLLEYGIAHYSALIQMRALCLSDGPGKDPGALTLIQQDIAGILSHPPSSRLRAALRICTARPNH